MEAFDLYMIFLFSIIVIAYISHSPLFKLKSSKLEEIAQKGLIHYTTKENAEKIINDGFLKGQKSDLIGPERFLGNLVWTYQYEDEFSVTERAEYLSTRNKAKKNKENFKVCLKLSGFTENDLKRLRTRKGVIRDNAVVYYGSKLQPQKIEMINP